MADKGERKKRSKNKNGNTFDVTKLRDNSATPKSKRRFNPVVVFEDEGVDDFVEHISVAKIWKKDASKKTAKSRQEKDPSSSKIIKLESKKKQSKSLIPVESKPELVTEEASSSRKAKIEIEKTKSSTPRFESNPKSQNVSHFGAEKLFRFPISSSPIVQLPSAESALGRRRSALSSNPTLPKKLLEPQY